MMAGSRPILRCRVLDTGYCLASEHHLLRGGRRRTIQCHSIVALLEHPVHGHLLWDAGYAPRMLQVTRGWPWFLYRRVTPLRLKPELAVVAQLKRRGLKAADVRFVVISHFHADHIAGLQDFPRAHFIASAAAYADVAKRRGLRALRRAFIPALLPSDFQERATLLSGFAGPSLPGLGATHDLFDDGSMLLVEMPGHARGQLGLLVHTDRGRILFAADGCWLTRSIRERLPPHPITRLFVDDWNAVRTTIEGLHTFARHCPDVLIVPTHCPEALAGVMNYEL